MPIGFGVICDDSLDCISGALNTASNTSSFNPYTHIHRNQTSTHTHTHTHTHTA